MFITKSKIQRREVKLNLSHRLLVQYGRAFSMDRKSEKVQFSMTWQLTFTTWPVDTPVILTKNTNSRSIFTRLGSTVKHELKFYITDCLKIQLVTLWSIVQVDTFHTNHFHFLPIQFVYPPKLCILKSLQ